MPDTTLGTDQLHMVEAAILPLVRYHLSALQGENPLAWRLAFGVAEQRWGEGRGLALAHRCQVFLSALLANRSTPVMYCDPLNTDERDALTKDEHTILAVVTAMRGDDTPRARQLMSELTANRVTAPLVKAGLSFALLLETPQTAFRRPKPPELKAVS